MATILLIETATQACSVALTIDNDIVAECYVEKFKVHASKLAPFVDEVLKSAGITISQCSAVAVSEGPGSYTGLRVGISTAKGLCYGADIPLISISTLDILAQNGKDYITNNNSVIVPMIDARRMEVYCATYDSECHRTTEIEAIVLDNNSFCNLFDKYDNVIFIGDGAMKFKSQLSEESLNKATFIEAYPSARYMSTLAIDTYKKEEFKDCAYFEPFYLKEFIAGISKKSIL